MTARISRGTWLRAAAAAAACGAAWGPAVPGSRAPVLRVLVADVSASVGPEGPSEQELAAVRAGLRRGDRAAVVAFADGARVLAPPSDAESLHVAGARPAPWATSLAAALRTAASLRREGEDLELVLLTDGRVTDGAQALADAADAVRAGGGAAVRVVERAPRAVPSVVTDLRGPGRALVGETIALEATGVAAPTGATVELLESGAVVESRRVAAGGPFRLVFSRTADAAGLRTWEARTLETPDAPAPAARVFVAAPGAVAVLHAGGPRADLERAAGPFAARIDVARTADGAVADAIAGSDAVIVDGADVPVGAIGPFVRRGGGAVLLAPGAALDDVSPLRTNPADPRGVCVYLAIDGSGSMGEPWRGAEGGPPRDVAIRGAADALARTAPSGTRLVLRRFREDVVPAGAPPAEIALGDGDRRAATDAVRDLPAPGGSTAFVPVLREAFDLLAARSEPHRTLLLLTDGQSSEDEAAVAAAAGRLIAAGVRVAVVVPGPLDASARSAVLFRALAGRDVAISDAGDPAGLGEALALAERRARGADEAVRSAALELAAGGEALLARGDVPSRAASFVRRFASPDATVLVRTPGGVEFAAVRAEGAGRIAAVAARAPDAGLEGADGGGALVRALVRAVRRRGSETLRVQADPDGLLLALGGGATGAGLRVRYLRRDAEVGTSGLVPAGEGLLRAAPPPDGADGVSVVDAQGAEVAAAGLGRSGTRESGDLPPADLGAIAARMLPPVPGPPRSLRTPLAALAVALLVAGSVKSRARPAR